MNEKTVDEMQRGAHMIALTHDVLETPGVDMVHENAFFENGSVNIIQEKNGKNGIGLYTPLPISLELHEDAKSITGTPSCESSKAIARTIDQGDDGSPSRSPKGIALTIDQGDDGSVSGASNSIGPAVSQRGDGSSSRNPKAPDLTLSPILRSAPFSDDGAPKSQGKGPVVVKSFSFWLPTKRTRSTTRGTRTSAARSTKKKKKKERVTTTVYSTTKNRDMTTTKKPYVTTTKKRDVTSTKKRDMTTTKKRDMTTTKKRDVTTTKGRDMTTTKVVRAQAARAKKSSSSRQCLVKGCTKLGRMIGVPDEHGLPGPRCHKHGGAHRCAVDGCSNQAVGGPVRIPLGPPVSWEGVAAMEEDAHAGPLRNNVNTRVELSRRRSTQVAYSRRCKRHGGGGRCPIDDCPNTAASRVRTSDIWGPPGLRCIRHGGGRKCSFEGCTTYALSYVSKVEDTLGAGAPGLRCKRHGGGRRCNLNICNTSAEGRPVTTGDEFGPPGYRCIRHRGGRRCTFEGCTRYAVGASSSSSSSSSSSDASKTAAGAPSAATPPSGGPSTLGQPRCKTHGGGKRCSVEGCVTPSGGRVPVGDRYGGPGLRCCPHGGGYRCSVEECANHSKRRVDEADAFGAPGRRCIRHGGKKKDIMV